jgi:hypothetical protein
MYFEGSPPISIESPMFELVNRDYNLSSFDLSLYFKLRRDWIFMKFEELDSVTFSQLVSFMVEKLFSSSLIGQNSVASEFKDTNDDIGLSSIKSSIQ